MKSLIRPLVLMLCVSLAVPQLFAQDEKAPGPPKKKEDIVIRKKGDSKEKMTIVIDGDKVTVNGKPVDDYKNDDVMITRDGDMFMHGMGMATAPGHMMNRNFMKEMHSNKAFLGVMTKKVANGAEVTEVTKESAAEKAGFKEGDIITKINDEKIADADDLYRAIGKYKPEDKVTVSYTRAGKENKSTVTLGENNQVKVYSWNNGDNDNFEMDGDFDFDFEPPMASLSPGAPYLRNFSGRLWDNKPRLGIQVQETEDNKGVKVIDVDHEGQANEAGIEEDDIITDINGKPITSIDTLKDVMKDAKEGDTVKLGILRDGKSQTISVKFPKELKTTDL